MSAIVRGTVMDANDIDVAYAEATYRFVDPLPQLPDNQLATATVRPDGQGKSSMRELIGLQATEEANSGLSALLLPPAETANALGTLHGGVSFSAATLVATQSAANPKLVISSATLWFLRPLKLGLPTRIEATNLHSGRTQSVVAIDLHSPDNKRAIHGIVSFRPREDADLR